MGISKTAAVIGEALSDLSHGDGQLGLSIVQEMMRGKRGMGHDRYHDKAQTTPNSIKITLTSFLAADFCRVSRSAAAFSPWRRRLQQPTPERRARDVTNGRRDATGLCRSAKTATRPVSRVASWTMTGKQRHIPLGKQCGLVTCNEDVT